MSDTEGSVWAIQASSLQSNSKTDLQALSLQSFSPSVTLRFGPSVFWLLSSLFFETVLDSSLEESLEGGVRTLAARRLLGDCLSIARRLLVDCSPAARSLLPPSKFDECFTLSPSEAMSD